VGVRSYSEGRLAGALRTPLWDLSQNSCSQLEDPPKSARNYGPCFLNEHQWRQREGLTP